MRNLLSLVGKIVCSLVLIFFVTGTLVLLLNDELDRPGNDWWYILFNLIYPLGIYFLVRLLNSKLNGLDASRTGFDVKHAFRKAMVGLSLALVVIAAVVMIGKYCGVTFLWGLSSDEFVPLLKLLAANWAIGAWEEMYFRGFVFPALVMGKTRFHLAALITAVLFTVLHAGTYDMEETSRFWFVEVMLLSYVLLYLYMYTRSIWAAVAFHASWDLGWDIVDKINVQGAAPAVLLDTISIPVLAVLLAAIIYLQQRKDNCYTEFLSPVAKQ